MGKRGNDANQESKEEYEARERREALLGGSNQDDGFSRASQETIKSRRIIKVSSKWKRNKTAGAGAGAGAGIGGMGGGLNIRTPTIPSASTSTNPFANTVLPPSKSIMSSISNGNGNSGDADSKPNPFASVSFASATPAKSTTTFKFGGGNSSDVPSTTKRTKTDATTTGSNLFQFNASSTNTTTSTTKPSFSTSTSQPSKSQSPKNKSNNTMPQLRDGAKENDSIPLSEKTLLNLSMLRMAQLEYQANPLSDWTEWMKKYITKVEIAEKKEDVARQVALQEKASSPSSVTTAATTKTGNVKPFTGFSFASSATTTTAPTPAPATTTTTTTNTTTNDKDKDTPGYQELLKPDQVLKTINEDEIELYECKAKYRKQITTTTNNTNKKEWKSYSAGTLRITKSKSNHTYQLVIRDLNVGKVQFNIALSKGMNFNEPVVSKGKASILFVAVQDPKKGAELFALIVKMEDKDGLYGILSSIGAGSA